MTQPEVISNLLEWQLTPKRRSTYGFLSATLLMMAVTIAPAYEEKWEPKKLGEGMTITLVEPQGAVGDRHNLHWTEFARLRTSSASTPWICNQSAADLAWNESHGRKQSTGYAPVKLPPLSAKYPEYVFIDWPQFADKSHYESVEQPRARNDNSRRDASLSSYTVAGEPGVIFGDLGQEWLYASLNIRLVLLPEDFKDPNGKVWPDTLNKSPQVSISYSYPFSSNAVGCELKMKLQTNRDESHYAWERRLNPTAGGGNEEERKARIRAQLAAKSGQPFSDTAQRLVSIGVKGNTWEGGEFDPNKPNPAEGNMLGMQTHPDKELGANGKGTPAAVGDPIKLHDVRVGDWILVRCNNLTISTEVFRGYVAWLPTITNTGEYKLSSMSYAFKDVDTSSDQIVAVKIIGAGVSGVAGFFTAGSTWGYAFAGAGFLATASAEVAGANPTTQIGEAKFGGVFKIEGFVDGPQRHFLKVARTGCSVTRTNDDPEVVQSEGVKRYNHGGIPTFPTGTFSQVTVTADYLKRDLVKKLSDYDAIPSPKPVHTVGKVTQGAAQAEVHIGVWRYDTWIQDNSISLVSATTSASASTTWRVNGIDWSLSAPAVTP